MHDETIVNRRGEARSTFRGREVIAQTVTGRGALTASPTKRLLGISAEEGMPRERRRLLKIRPETHEFRDPGDVLAMRPAHA